MSPLERPTVAAVVLNWNCTDETLAAIQSIALSKFDGAVQCLVIDNGSCSGELELLRTSLPGHAQLIENTENRGFARACNQGLVAGYAAGADYFLLLNSDARLDADALSAAVATMQRVGAGLLSGKIYEDAGRLRLSYAGGRVSLLVGRAIVPSHGRTERARDNVSRRTSFVTGAFLLLSRRAYEVLGGLPEDYFFGNEEADLSLQAARSGVLMWYEPLAQCVHTGAVTHRRSSARYVYNGYRNKLILEERYLSRPAWMVWLAAFSIYSRWIAGRLRSGLHPSDVTPRVITCCAGQAIADHRRGWRVELSQLDSCEARFSL